MFLLLSTVYIRNFAGVLCLQTAADARGGRTHLSSQMNYGWIEVSNTQSFWSSDTLKMCYLSRVVVARAFNLSTREAEAGESP